VIVGGDEKKRHGIVLAKNEIAKKYGVQTGETLWQAKQKCPGVVFVPPDFKKYMKFSKLAREIYESYTDQVESFGLDECWLDVTASTHLFGCGKTIADDIRARIRRELGVSASVGVSFNKVFAKLGSDYKKPNATTVISKDHFQEIVWPLPVGDLLYVGPATKKKLHRFGVQTIGQLANTDVKLLQYVFGKIGVMLWEFANGKDSSPVAAATEKHLIKSIGNSTTTARDLVCEEDVKITLYVLCESVAQRMREQHLRCNTVQIVVRNSDLYFFERQGKTDGPICTAKDLFERAFSLFQQCYSFEKPIRSIGVRACQLVRDEASQLSFLPERIQRQKQEALEETMDTIRRRFGHFSVQRGIMLNDPQLSGINPKEDHVIYPESYLKPE
jgi:DNA polymerase-4